MLIINRPSWYIPESQSTDEKFFLNRRELGKKLAAGALIPALGMPMSAYAGDEYTNATKQFYPAKGHAIFDENNAGRQLTNEKDATSYNNFYEFGSHKSISGLSQKMKVYPWILEINQPNGKTMKISIDDILKKIPLETRVYRFRCVETWAMTVPWQGFAFSKLLSLFGVSGTPKFVQMQTVMQPDNMPGMREPWYPWPFIENLEYAEAMNELAFLAVGAYNKPLPNQMGAPLRLVVPWKYGFKNIKSISKITITDNRAKSFWEEVQGNEYGFYANVNPDVPHMRWSQAREKMLGTGETIPTRIYNGYGEHVAALYKDKPQNRTLFF